MNRKIVQGIVAACLLVGLSSIIVGCKKDPDADQPVPHDSSLNKTKPGDVGGGKGVKPPPP